MPDVTVTNNEELTRYEVHSDGTLAGFAEYSRRAGSIRFTHTEVDPAFQGRGLAQTLAQEALTDAAASGDEIVPLCPFIEKYLRSNDIPGAQVRWPQRPQQ
ncbi:GNAT family N-acetyltransferase [Microbacterium sp. YY-01]|uniref:GNAT family N-acetyltransferase n=1 Tax=Microbacterium sp. YY-01 TaxID=3421634 RepID=UPI003D17A0A5